MNRRATFNHSYGIIANLTSVSVIIFFILLSSSLLPAETSNEIAFATLSGYFVSNRFEPDAPTSFVVARDQATFDHEFGVAMVMGDKSNRLSTDAFASRIVVAAIHRGGAMVSYRVEHVVVEGKTLVVRYTTASVPSDTAEFACPLILSIPKGDYHSVEFVENGKEMKKVPTEGRLP
jgi:hypothetical protein